MSVDEMRIAIVNAYKGPAWRAKVRSMSDEQVVAIYYRITNGKPARKNGKSTTDAETYLNTIMATEAIKESRKTRAPYEHEEDGPKQLSFADMLSEVK
jgi:hypothetical protein